MTHPTYNTQGFRESYLRAKGICPRSIPGRACLRGDWDGAPGFVKHAEGK